MSQRYLLPCDCGKTIPVGISQAGSAVQCDCGKSLPVPSIRGLKSLAVDPSTAAPSVKSKPVREINGVNLQGVAFVLGTMLLLAGLVVAGYYGYLYTHIDVKDYTAEEQQFAEGKLDEMGVMDLYSTWLRVEKDGLGDHHAPYHVLAREFSATVRGRMLLGVGLVVAGLGSCVYSFSGAAPVRRKT